LGFSGGLWVDIGDLDGDAVPEIVTGADAGGFPLVSVFDIRGRMITPYIAAFDFGFTGGGRVAVGDFSGTCRADIAAAAGPDGFPLVQIVDGRSFRRQGLPFEVFNHAFAGGVFISAGALDSSGQDRLLVGSGPGAAAVREFDAVGRLLRDVGH